MPETRQEFLPISHRLGANAVIAKIDRLLRSGPLERAVLVAVAFVSLIVIAWLDHVIDVGVGVAIFYVVPVALIAWRAPQRTASSPGVGIST